MSAMAENEKERAERLAAALRENLRKRKAQARQTGSSSPAKAGAQTGEADKR
jgi:hypothetical protein